MYLVMAVCAVSAFSLLNLMGSERTRLIAKAKLEAKNTPAPIPAPAAANPVEAKPAKSAAAAKK
jgi:hypothetical protein